MSVVEPDIIKGSFLEGTDPVIVARPAGPDGVTIFSGVQIGTVPLNVFDRSSDTPQTAVTTVVDTATSFFASIQPPDSYWGDTDTIGYSYLHQITGLTSVGGRTYRVEVQIHTLTPDLGIVWIIAELACVGVFTA